MKRNLLLLAAACAAGHADAASIYLQSPTAGGTLPGGISVVGGSVADFIGLNGIRIVTQIAASSQYMGSASGNPLTFGTQTGFTPALLANLGGGISELSIRVTLYDGDTAAGNFDYMQNTLLVDGVSLEDFSMVPTTGHDAVGNPNGPASAGFGDNVLTTGFFYSNNSADLANIYSELQSTGRLTLGINDVDPGDNYYDFTQGINQSFIDVGTPPQVSSVPEPSGPMGLTLLVTSGAFLRRRIARRA